MAMAVTDHPPIEVRRRRLAVLPDPFEGHLNQMFQLAAALHSRGFPITIIHTHFNAPNPAMHPSFDFVAIPDGLTLELLSSGDFMAMLRVINATIETPVRERLTQLRLASSPDPISCVVFDACFYSVARVAEELQLPKIVLQTSNASTFHILCAFPELWEKGYYPIKDPESTDPVSEIPPYRMRDLPYLASSTPDSIREEVGLMVQAVKSSAGLVLNTFDALELTVLPKLKDTLRQIPMFPLGPLHKLSPNHAAGSYLADSQDRSCLEWLNNQALRSVLYVSIGSVATMDWDDLLEMAWGLANSHQPFLWVLRQGVVRGVEGTVVEQLPEDLKQEMMNGRGKVVQWAPQLEVLGHPAVGGFWSHCGWNSTLESLSEGVPVLCWPQFWDQLVNARWLTSVLTVGINPMEESCRLERKGIEGAIKRLMSTDHEGNEMRRKARDIKVEAEHCIKEGGTTQDALDRLVELILSTQAPYKLIGG